MKKILVVEDNQVNRELVREMLEAKGFEVVEAENGAQALESLQTSVPDLVLLDIQMPVLDGIGAMKEIRLQPRFANLPVLALTAYTMLGDRERVMAAGFSGYLTKPIERMRLMEAIGVYLA